MLTVDELRSDLHVYFDEMNRCTQSKCYWALIHLTLTIPDICASLEWQPGSGPDKGVGDRYIDWCDRYMPHDPAMTPGDRYQMRNIVLHLGSSTTESRRRKAAGTKSTQYKHFSFLEPSAVHDTRAHHKILTFPRLTPTPPQRTITLDYESFLALLDAFEGCAQALRGKLDLLDDLHGMLPGKDQVGTRKVRAETQRERETLVRMLADLQAIRAGAGPQADWSA